MDFVKKCCVNIVCKVNNVLKGAFNCWLKVINQMLTTELLYR